MTITRYGHTSKSSWALGASNFLSNLRRAIIVTLRSISVATSSDHVRCQILYNGLRKRSEMSLSTGLQSLEWKRSRHLHGRFFTSSADNAPFFRIHRTPLVVFLLLLFYFVGIMSFFNLHVYVMLRSAYYSKQTNRFTHINCIFLNYTQLWPSTTIDPDHTGSPIPGLFIISLWMSSEDPIWKELTIFKFRMLKNTMDTKDASRHSQLLRQALPRSTTFFHLSRLWMAQRKLCPLLQ